MLEKIQVESINVGCAQTIRNAGKSLTSGICKYAVAGPVYLDEVGVHDDAVVDQLHHGGADQAVYIYSADDYDWWNSETDRDYWPGLFGENLTIRGLPFDLNVGDRLLVGEVVLEATAPRIPCSTLAVRMRDSAFALAFRRAQRPGVYFRVLNSGEISAGDAVTLVANESGDVSILELFRFNYALRHDAADLHRFLGAPLADRFRRKIQSKLEAIERPSD